MNRVAANRALTENIVSFITCAYKQEAYWLQLITFAIFRQDD